MLTAMLSVENIFGAHHDVWSVNVEDEYHEESARPAPRANGGTGRDAPVLPRASIDAAAQRRREGGLMRVQVCTPTYIEAENIEEFLRRARGGGARAPTSSCSTTTAPTARPTSPSRSAAELGQIEVLRRPEKRGLGAAYRAGFAVGIARGYDVICQIDADLSHDPAGAPGAARARSRTGPISRSGRGTCRAARSRTGPGAGAGPVEVRQHVHAVHAADGRDGRLGRVPGVPRRTCSSESTSRPRARRATDSRSRSTYRVARCGGTDRRGPDHLHRPRAGHSKMSLAVMVEEMVLDEWWGIRDRFRASVRSRPDAGADFVALHVERVQRACRRRAARRSCFTRQKSRRRTLVDSSLPNLRESFGSDQSFHTPERIAICERARSDGMPRVLAFATPGIHLDVVRAGRVLGQQVVEVRVGVRRLAQVGRARRRAGRRARRPSGPRASRSCGRVRDVGAAVVEACGRSA